MRIKKEINDFIKTYVNENFTGASVYLFGSRTDDDKKGGDIDILILTNEKLTFSDLSRMRTSFYKVFVEQKIDLVNFTFDDNKPFKNIALETAVEL